MSLNAEKLRKIQTERIEKFVSKEAWTDINLFSKLYKSRDASAVTLEVFSCPEVDPNHTDKFTYEEAVKQEFKPAQVGQSFGPTWATHWFKVSATIPPMWLGEQVNFIWDSESEAAVWVDGQPVQAFNGSKGDDRRADYVLTRSAKAGETFHFYVEMACCGMFGNPGPGGFLAPPDPKKSFTLKIAELAVYDKDAWDLFFDLNLILDMSKELDENDTRGWQAIETARKIVNALQTDDRSTWPAAKAISAEFLSKKSGERAHTIFATGHCHIDSAWLWPYSETRRKVARSFSTQCTLMESYPEFKFAASQAAQYDWVKNKYPKLYERMKEYVTKAQFIPIGGTWVEMDCNVPSGESFVRQFLHGQLFFEKEFGARCEVFWLPDTFGYSSQLPQIVKGSDMKYFLTQKLSWNLINKFPHNTFMWEGLDGTQVLSHFPPADTYCSKADVKDILYTQKNFKTKDKSNQSMLLFGFGDGGGGPDVAMIERLRRESDVDGLPKVSIQNPTDFFHSVVKNDTDLPVWVGELYFELHRGTYTTHARNKLGNRRSEFWLQQCEFVCVLAAALAMAEYPAAELERIWKMVLLHQFHDVLPGTSIGLVYRDTDHEYREIARATKQIIDSSLSHLASALRGLQTSETESTTRLTVFNTLAWERVAIVELPGALEGAQKSRTGKELGVVHVPSMGIDTHASVHMSIKSPTLLRGDELVSCIATATHNEEGIVLENSLIKATFNLCGELVSLIHKATNRESISKGAVGNKFVLYDDVPFFWDAWDVEVYHTEKVCKMEGLPKLTLEERGPLRVSFKLDYKISEHSWLCQHITLDAGSDLLVFDTTVSWHENRKFLKVDFPLNVYATQATYSTHFGCQQRPTHRNTTWDIAKFEVCAQHWADLSEYGFGVAILNDSKYGYSCLGNKLTLSLLRSPKMPDDSADMGLQSFKYAVLPHAGDHRDAKLTRRGFEFNQPLIVAPTFDPLTALDKPSVLSFFSVDKDNIILETVKKAEKSHDIIIRLWESCGGRGTVKVSTSNLVIGKATRCNLLEDNQTPLKVAGGSFDVAFGPFEVITVRLSVA